jgi:homoaconitate hydratase
MDARFSISNMSTEWGPLVGWFPVDAVTIKYLAGVQERLAGQGIARFSDDDLLNWTTKPPQPDADAVYAARIVLDLAQVTPHVSGPDTVQIMSSLAEMEKRKLRSEGVFAVLREFTARFSGRGRCAARQEGRGRVKYLRGAPAGDCRTRQRGAASGRRCSTRARILCLRVAGLALAWSGLLEPGEVGISATNRNFKGRGSRDEVLPASPRLSLLPRGGIHSRTVQATAHRRGTTKNFPRALRRRK